MEIKLATNDDCFELSVMTGELLQEIMDKINIKVFNFDQIQTEKRAKYLISQNKYFVFIAKNNDDSIGFVSMYESYALYAEGAYGTIPELYVRPRYRSNGIGKKLLKQVKIFAKEKNWKRLEVTTPPLPEFDRTLSFYQNNCFEISGGRKLKSEVS